VRSLPAAQQPLVAQRRVCIYIDRMTLLADASLAADEQTLLERFIEELRERMGDELHAVWLFGSRARGEQPAPDSDVDVLVLVDDASWDGRMRVRSMLDDAARKLGLEALTWSFSVHVHTRSWLAQRREIESFFIAEVDHDKIALCGSV
jgi:predicted nucleotidyltransferase